MRSAWTTFASHVLFPLHERLKRHQTVAVRQRLEDSQWWSPERLRADQWSRTEQFLREIAQTVPYYERLFGSLNLFGECRFDRAQFERIPLLDKSVIRANVNDLRSRTAGPLQRFNTGGSSGEPLVFYLGNERISHDVAAKWRATRWWDVDIGDRELVIWGSPIELGAQDRIRVVRDKLLRSRLVSAFELSAHELNTIVEKINRFKPKMLFGYPSALAKIAAFIEKHQLELPTQKPRVAFVTSEMLYQHQREQIERVFACPVANGYGSRDAGFIAHQCPQGSLHISAEDILVEIVDAQGNPVATGDAGEIVVTHLATSEFPFVRYRTGDMGILSDERCACGRGLPILKEVQGRTTDFITASDGTQMHGLALIYILRDLPEISAFKIVQESLRNTRVFVTPGEGWRPSLSDQIIDGFKKRLGDDVLVEVELTDKIPAEASGKHRYVVSKVAAS